MRHYKMTDGQRKGVRKSATRTTAAILVKKRKELRTMPPTQDGSPSRRQCRKGREIRNLEKVIR